MIDHLLQSIPPLAVYLVVGLIVLAESVGIPLPGEITLASAAAWLGLAAAVVAGLAISLFLKRKARKQGRTTQAEAQHHRQR